MTTLNRRDFMLTGAAAGIGLLLGDFRQSALAGTVATTTSCGNPGPSGSTSTPLVGARINDVTWAQADQQIGPIRVTRLFYTGQLPSSFTRQGVPTGVRLIVSYKQGGNTASYVRSIPATEDVELVFHHEPEGGDFSSGAAFVSAFNAEQQVAKAANPSIPFGFIAGGYQYRPGNNGYTGAYVPPQADRYYMDSYQRGGTEAKWSPILPASQDPQVQRYITLLGNIGKQFNGFTEYARGVVWSGNPLTSQMVQERLAVFKADNAYLRTLPAFRVLSYWYTTDKFSGRQWRLTDATSQAGWQAVAAS